VAPMTAAGPATPDRETGGLAETVLSLYEETNVADTVGKVLDFGRTAVGCSHASVVFVHARKKIETVATTHPELAALEAKQMELHEGPDVTIVDGRNSVVVDDTHTDERWPSWAAAAAEAGFRSLVGVRLYTSERTFGSLNLYDSRPHHFTEEDRQVAHVVARHAAIALAKVHESDHLWRAIDARKLIGQAQGILMERYDLDEGRAFEALRRYSQDNNVKLRDVAAMVVSERRLADSPDLL
jgi:GAF domain-containing protein